MLNAPHSSSSRKAALLVMASLAGMAGCSSGSGLLSSNGDFLSKLNLDTLSPVTTASISQAPPKLRPRIEPAGDIKIVTPVEEQPKSAWCEHLKEASAIDATVLRAPTLNGSLNDSGRASLGLSLSASNFARANLIEEAASIKCKRYLAELGLQKLVFVSPQNLTAAGYKAKANAIFGQKNEIVRLRKSIEKSMAGGSIDREKATSIYLLIDRLLAEASAAKSQADRRISERLLSGKNANVLSQELLQAEHDLDGIDSRMRTADALDVSVQAGWGDDITTSGINVNDQSFSGKVSFSVKLGAFNPQRFEHERLASQAKQRAIKNEEGGSVWQIGVLRRAHERAIAGLEESQAKLDKAMQEATHLLGVLASVQQPEFEGARLNARYEIMKLKADRAGVAGSLAEIRTNLSRLQNG
jgi:hypothetical protein